MKRKYAILVLLMVVLLTACSKNKVEESEPDESNEPEQSEETATNIASLTGLPVEGEINNRPISVMVNNQIQARPQTGLSNADIVFEILSEASITRFLAIYQSDLPEVVGPVRSAREYYFELAQGYDAIYIHHGAAKFVSQMIKDRGIDYIDGGFHDNDGVLFKRESFRKAPHNSYLQMKAVYDEAEAEGYTINTDIAPLPFVAEGEEISGEAAASVEIAYSNAAGDLVEYRYDETLEKYTRYMGGEQFIELNTEEPILTDNIFIVETEHEVIDDEGRRAVDITSGGNALLIRKGKVETLEWKNENGYIIPVKDGETVGFTPGKTWINIVPTSPGMDQSVQINN